MHVRPGLAGLRHAVDCADRLAIDQDDPLVAPGNIWKELLHDQRLAAHAGEQLVQRSQVAVVRVQPEHAGPAIAVQRLQDDVAMPCLEGADRRQIAGDHRWRGQLRIVENQQLFRRIAHPERIVHHQRAGMDALQDMGCGDIAHVKGRILAQPDDIKGRKVHLDLVAIGHMVSLLAAQFDWKSARGHAALVEGQLVRRVEEKRMPARLRLKRDAERAVPVDVDRPDRVHLQCNFQAHAVLRDDAPTWRSAARVAIARGQAAKAFSMISMRPASSTKATSNRAAVSCPAGSCPRKTEAEA